MAFPALALRAKPLRVLTLRAVIRATCGTPKVILPNGAASVGMTPADRCIQARIAQPASACVGAAEPKGATIDPRLAAKFYRRDDAMNELTLIKPGADVQAFRASTDAAEMCKGIVMNTAVKIQGRQYVPVEGWQAIAIAHGCAAASRDVQRVEGGVRAIGEVRRMSDGQLISTAEGFVGEDEATWFGGEMHGKSLPKRADYAIRAMAQTRAISRACRSAFAHVVVMMNKGLATTPAEEVYDAETGIVIQAFADAKIAGITKIKERLGKMMTEGNAMTDAAAFGSLVKANKDDLKTLRDGNHQWWNGDGEDFEGYNAWIARRRAELAPKEPDSLGLAMLLSALDQCATRDDLNSLLDEHGSVAETLDGEESRRWQDAFDGRETGIMAAAPLGAG